MGIQVASVLESRAQDVLDSSPEDCCQWFIS